jgi:hypothetical protein
MDVHDQRPRLNDRQRIWVALAVAIALSLVLAAGAGCIVAAGAGLLYSLEATDRAD